MIKQDLRVEFLERMKALRAGQVDDKSQAIAEQFFRHFKLSEECIHIFLSITKNNEVNTFHFINQILREYPSVQIAVPKSNFTNGEMINIRYDLHTTLKVNKLGIPEPVKGESVDPSCFDIVLVPLLCFDKRGYRVGYGKGFYDRFLAKCKPGTRKIGLSLFPPVEEISDTADYDIRLDACIEPEQIHYFTPQS